MKRKLLISFIISFITVLGLNVSAQADTTTTQVTSNSYEDSMPQIKGDYLVWQGHVNGHWQIFLYNIENEEATRITNNNYDSISPRTDGEYVVWFGACNQGGEVFQYNIATGETTKITNDSNVDSSPQIADGQVVWASHQVTDSVEPGEIKIYDINTGQHDQLTHTQQDDSSPRINSESVIWIQTDGADNSVLFIHDISQGTTQEAPEGFIWEDSPQTDGDLTVSMTNDGDWEIIVRQDGQNGFEQVTNNNLDDRYPGISGNYITWMAGEGNSAEIYLALVDFAAPPPPPPPSEVIVDNDESGTSSTGNWYKSGGANPYGAESLYSRTAGATYTFSAPINGSCEVSLWWTEWSSRNTGVPIRIYDGNTLLDTVEVNQKANGGKWNALGNYTFSGTAKIVIVSESSSTSTCADAVRFGTATGPPPPPPPPPSEVIVDNDESGTSSTGNWYKSGGANPYGAESLYSRTAGATYTFSAPINGSCEVSLWWTEWSSRNTGVPIRIYDGDTLLDTVEVNQKANGGKWNVLGNYTFSGTAKIVIVSEGGSTSTCADAVRFGKLVQN